MNVSGAIKQMIAGNVTANALLAGRVYPVLAPQDSTYPCAVVSIISNTPNDTKSGVSDVDSVLVQVSTFSTSYGSAANTSEAVRRAIDRYRGNITSGTTTIPVDGVRFLDMREVFEPDPEIWHIAADYQMRIQRDALTGTAAVVGLQTYDSDSDAIAAGLSAGDFYLLGAGNIYGMKEGTLVTVASL